MSGWAGFWIMIGLVVGLAFISEAIILVADAIKDRPIEFNLELEEDEDA